MLIKIHKFSLINEKCCLLFNKVFEGNFLLNLLIEIEKKLFIWVKVKLLKLNKYYNLLKKRHGLYEFKRKTFSDMLHDFSAFWQIKF